MLKQLPQSSVGCVAAVLSEAYFQKDGNQAKQELLQVVVTVSINDCYTMFALCLSLLSDVFICLAPQPVVS